MSFLVATLYQILRGIAKVSCEIGHISGGAGLRHVLMHGNVRIAVEAASREY